MRKYILNGDKRVKVIALTPAKGSDGDLTVQSDLIKTNINNILHRYAGNLAELKAWQDGKEYGVQSPMGDDLLDATQVFDRLERQYHSNEELSKVFDNFGAFINAVSDGTIYDVLNSKLNSKGEKHEQKTENKSEGEPKDIQKIGEPTPPPQH